MKHVFIIDPKSFRGQQWKMDGLLDSIGQYFRTRAEKPNFSTIASYYPRSAIGLIQKQVDQAEEDETVRVYAIGGDDMLFDCLNGITGLPNMELAVAPYGASNNFIRALAEGKIELFKDIPALAESADVVPTDVISAGNNCAINGCSVGYTPAIAMKRAEIRSRLETGPSRFFIGFWFAMNGLTSLFDKDLISRHYQITIDGEDFSGNYSQINIFNAPYHGRKKARLQGALPDDGLLDVVLFKSVSPLATWSTLKKFDRGKIASNGIRMQAKKIEVKADQPMWIRTDSEYLQDTSITFEAIPEAVQIVTINNFTYQGQGS